MTDVVLLLRDGLFLKDGREWATADAGRAHSLLWPMPSTLLGALVTARGRTKEGAGESLGKDDWLALAAATDLGPTTALRRPLTSPSPSWAAAHRVWPVPADALFLAGDKGEPERVLRLDPQPPLLTTLGRDDERVREALWRPRVLDQAKPAKAPVWWADEAFINWLADPSTDRPCKGAWRGLDLPRHVQSHVGIDPKTLAAREEILFAHDVVETIDGEHHEWTIACRVTPAEETVTHVTLGGDRRLTWAERPAMDLFAFPPALAAAFGEAASKGMRLIAVTPAAFKDGWLPDGFAAIDSDAYFGRLPGLEAELILRAAFVPRAAHVSGWDMARARPKPTTRLVPPGAVYHFVRKDGGSFSTEAAGSLWLTPLGERTREGFGYFVPGIWQPNESST
jgi:CRISPR-associated protein Cmr3